MTLGTIIKANKWKLLLLMIFIVMIVAGYYGWQYYKSNRQWIYQCTANFRDFTEYSGTPTVETDKDNLTFRLNIFNGEMSVNVGNVNDRAYSFSKCHTFKEDKSISCMNHDSDNKNSYNSAHLDFTRVVNSISISNTHKDNDVYSLTSINGNCDEIK